MQHYSMITNIRTNHFVQAVACAVFISALCGLGLKAEAATITINPAGGTGSSNTIIQNAINGAGSGDTVIFNAGTYNISGAISLKSGVSLQGQPGAILMETGTDTMFEIYALNNITISRLIFDGGGTKLAPGEKFIYIDGGSNHIHIQSNTFRNFTAYEGPAGDPEAGNGPVAIEMWVTQNTYVQGNTITNGFQGINWRMNARPASPMSTMIVSDNTISNMMRMGIETSPYGNFTNIHFDRNDVSNTGSIALSLVGIMDSGTIWGNTIHNLPSGGNYASWGLEIGGDAPHPFGMTVSQNKFNGMMQWGMGIAHAPGLAILNNTFTGVTTPYSTDGGYDSTEWIGTNTINGSSSTGWAGHTYGAQPTLYSPSAPYGGTIVIGDATILPNDDSGNANEMDASEAILSQTATIQSLSFYVPIAAGELRLAIYDATGTGGRPGILKAQTKSFVPVVGWNTVNVVTPVSLPAGTYWLAKLNNNNNMHERTVNTGVSTWVARTFKKGFRARAPAMGTAGSHWSFYATLTTSGAP